MLCLCAYLFVFVLVSGTQYIEARGGYSSGVYYMCHGGQGLAVTSYSCTETTPVQLSAWLII